MGVISTRRCNCDTPDDSRMLLHERLDQKLVIGDGDYVRTENVKLLSCLDSTTNVVLYAGHHVNCSLKMNCHIGLGGKPDGRKQGTHHLLERGVHLEEVLEGAADAASHAVHPQSIGPRHEGGVT